MGNKVDKIIKQCYENEIYTEKNRAYNLKARLVGAPVIAYPVLSSTFDSVYIKDIDAPPEATDIIIYVPDCVVGFYDSTNEDGQQSSIFSRFRYVRVIGGKGLRNTEEMFFNSRNLMEVDLSEFCPNGITSMAAMFEDCVKLTSVKFGNIDTSYVNNMTGMFSGCRSLKSVDLRNFNTRNLTYTSSMFRGCTALSEVFIGSWNVSRLLRMTGMFSGCSSLKSVDIDKWRPARLEDMVSTFRMCMSLESVDLSDWDMSSLDSLEECFSNCTSLKEVKFGNNPINAVGMIMAFYNCFELEFIDLSKFDGTKMDEISMLASGCVKLRELRLPPKLGVGKLDLSHLIHNCVNLTHLDMSLTVHEGDFKDVIGHIFAEIWKNNLIVNGPDGIDYHIINSTIVEEKIR